MRFNKASTVIRKKSFFSALLILILSLLSLLVFHNSLLFFVLIIIAVILIFLDFIVISRKLFDTIGTKVILSITLFIVVLFFFLFIVLLNGSFFLLEHQSLSNLLFSSTWKPFSNKFGLFAVIIDTLLVTAISLVIAIPISLFTAIYITEYAPAKVRSTIRPFIDVLAGVPSVVFGLCALLVFVPVVRDVIAPFFGVNISSGFCIFTASLILSIMVFPIIISLCIESFSSVPIALKEASLSLGATKWETVKKVLFRASGPGVLSAIFLGFGRAFGETIAVAMVIGNQELIPSTLFGPGQTLASLIANNYVEISSIPLLESALIFVALILFAVVLLFNIGAYIIMKKASKRWKY